MTGTRKILLGLCTAILIGFVITLFLPANFLPANKPALVKDQAGLLSQRDAEWIETFHGKLLEEYDIDYRVITGRDLGDISIYTHNAFKNIKTGELSQSGRGILLLIDPAQDRVRLEVSGALEPVYTDQFVSYIQTRQMIPFFTANRVSDGILATTELLFRRAREASDGQEFTFSDTSFSAGGGAERSAEIGSGVKGLPSYKSRATPVPEESLSPFQVVDLYNRSMANRDANFIKRIYTKASQDMMAKMVVTPAQMDSAVKAYQNCGKGHLFTLENMAVIRYDVERRECFPYFLLFEDKQWKLDFATMGNSIRFNHNNDWHYVTGQNRPPYNFAFGDSAFDKYGYPHSFSSSRLKAFRWKISHITLPSGKTYVTWVGEGSPAEDAGFRFGDELVQIQGRTVVNSGMVANVLAEVQQGEIMKTLIRRNGRELVIDALAPEPITPSRQ